MTDKSTQEEVATKPPVRPASYDFSKDMPKYLAKKLADSKAAKVKVKK
jgi:hypothetical protein